MRAIGILLVLFSIGLVACDQPRVYRDPPPPHAAVPMPNDLRTCPRDVGCF